MTKCQDNPDKVAVPMGVVTRDTDPKIIESIVPFPVAYPASRMPQLTASQLAVLNYMVWDKRNSLGKGKFCELMGWPNTRFSVISRTEGLVRALASLWRGEGTELQRQVPEIMQARAKQAKSTKRGANAAARLVLEAAGVLGAAGRSASVQLSADQINVSFTATLGVMREAVELAEAEEVSAP